MNKEVYFMYRKKTYPLTLDGGRPLAVVRLSPQKGCILGEASLVDKTPTEGLKIVVYDGEGFYWTALLQEFTVDGKFTEELSVALYRGDDILCAAGKCKGVFKRSFAEVVGEDEGYGNRACPAGAEAVTPYDDEQIAEENYYEGYYQNRCIKEEALSEEDNPFEDACLKKIRPKAFQKEEKPRPSYQDAPCLYPAEKSFDKVFGYGPCAGGDLPVSYKASQGEKRADRVSIYALMSSGERFFGLEKTIAFSRFYKISVKERFYLFGIVETDGAPLFLYAVPARLGERIKGFEKGFFIPGSFFDREEGFYCLVQRRDKG